MLLINNCRQNQSQRRTPAPRLEFPSCVQRVVIRRTEMKRHTITLGASTTAGGKVISASSSASINGVTIALEDDPVFCTACKSQGKILCVGPRIPETWNGKNVALENDLCICKCPSPPRLVPNQSSRYQNLSDNGMESKPAHVPGAVANTVKSESHFDDKFALLDEDTGEPLRHIEYAIRRANGQIEFGITDEIGHTHLLTAAANAESIEIYC
jgi:uncharacterized Zn-binding protein involved in type VI secretion